MRDFGVSRGAQRGEGVKRDRDFAEGVFWMLSKLVFERYGHGEAQKLVLFVEVFFSRIRRSMEEREREGALCFCHWSYFSFEFFFIV